MSRRYHLPTAIRWTDRTVSGAALDQRSIERVVLAAIERALADAPGGVAAVRHSAGLDERPAARFDPTRFRADHPGGDETYAIPSFGHGGRPVDLPVDSPPGSNRGPRVQAPRISAWAGITSGVSRTHTGPPSDLEPEPPEVPPDRSSHGPPGGPSTPPGSIVGRRSRRPRMAPEAGDVPGPGSPRPFRGQALLEPVGSPAIVLADLPPNRFGHLQWALDFATLAQEGNSLAVLEDPGPSDPTARYLVVPLEPPIPRQRLDEIPPEGWRLEVRGPEGTTYRLRAIVADDGFPVAPPDPHPGRVSTSALGGSSGAAPRARSVAPTPAVAIPRSASTPARFSPMTLLEEFTRLAWLEALLAGPLDEQGHATVCQLLTSFGDPESLATAVVSLRRSGRIAELTDEPERAIWILLHLGSVFEGADEAPRLDRDGLFEQVGLPTPDNQPVRVEARWLLAAQRHFGPAEGLEVGLARVVRLARQPTLGVPTSSAEALRIWLGLTILAPDAAVARHLAWLVVWALAADLEPVASEVLEEPWPIELLVVS